LPTLLHIDSSPRTEASISRHLSSEFAASWTSANPGGRTIVRDLTTTDLQPISSEWIAACHMSPSSRTASQSEILGLSDTLIAELKSADDYIIGVPMHNFGVPSSLKLWIDQIVRAGETFSYVDGAPAGLLKNKRATFIIASGGLYNAGIAMASFDFVKPYLRRVFGFVGVTDTRFVAAGGAAALMQGKIDRQTFLRPHLESIQAQFQAA
jgi:FMN-dependent NADH-azoreductase